MVVLSGWCSSLILVKNKLLKAVLGAWVIFCSLQETKATTFMKINLGQIITSCNGALVTPVRHHQWADGFEMMPVGGSFMTLVEVAQGPIEFPFDPKDSRLPREAASYADLFGKTMDVLSREAISTIRFNGRGVFYVTPSGERLILTSSISFGSIDYPEWGPFKKFNQAEALEVCTQLGRAIGVEAIRLPSLSDWRDFRRLVGVSIENSRKMNPVFPLLMGDRSDLPRRYWSSTMNGRLKGYFLIYEGDTGELDAGHFVMSQASVRCLISLGRGRVSR